MKTLFNICIIFCLSYLMACSTGEDEPYVEPVSPIVGAWTIENWYCTNIDNCSPAHQDLDAYLVFNVDAIGDDGSLTVTGVAYYSPACDANPNCDILDNTFTVDSASYIGRNFYMTISPTGWDQLDYVITGRLSTDVIVASVRYVGVGGEITYVMNDNLLATRED